MAITTLNKDYWDNVLYTVPYGMYFYLDNSLFQSEGGSNVSVLGNTNCIDSILWCPFLHSSDMDLAKIKYDVERFGNIKGKLPYTPYVYRVQALNRQTKQVGSNYDKFNKRYKTPYRSYENEGKLFQYPYSYCTVYDGMNEPLLIKPHLVRSEKITVKVKNSISDKCTFGLFVEGYEGADEDILNVQVNNAPLDLPVSSSAYAQWSSTQKATALQNRLNTINQNKLAMSQQGISAIGQTMGLNFDYSGEINNTLSALQNIQQTQKSFSATQTDLLNTPNSIKSGNGNVPFNMINGKRSLYLIRYSLQEDYAKTLGDYFALFGYKQNKIMDVQANLRTRYYYNYMKTVNVNIRSHLGVSKDNLQKIKAIFDKGVTVWHGDRDKNFFDYTYDNREVE